MHLIQVSVQVYCEINAFAFMLCGIRYGEGTSVNPDAPLVASGDLNPRGQTLSAKVITDAEIGYRSPRGFTVAVGANHLFDVYPDKEVKINSNTGTFLYSGYSPLGFFGRFIYTRLSVTL